MGKWADLYSNMREIVTIMKWARPKYWTYLLVGTIACSKNEKCEQVLTQPILCMVVEPGETQCRQLRLLYDEAQGNTHFKIWNLPPTSHVERMDDSWNPR